MPDHALLAAVIPVLVAVLGFVLFCLIDLLRRPSTSVAPRWVWAIACVAFIPWGAVLYLILGRADAPLPVPEGTQPPAPTGISPLLRAARPGDDDPSRLAVRTEALVCEYDGGAGRPQVGVHGVDLQVPARGVYGLVGPNGAGKTTLIGLLTGLRRADSGSVHLGFAPDRIAVCPDVAEFEPWLTATETVLLSRELVRGDSGTAPAQAFARDLLTRTGLGDAHDRRVGAFSRGMTQRLSMAAALVTEPEMLVFDEPTSALDPSGRTEVLDLLAELGGRVAVLLSSHILADVQRVADHVGVLVDGRLLYQGSTRELIEAHVRPAWEVRVHGDIAPLVAQLRTCSWVTGVEPVDRGTVRVTTSDVDRGGRALARLVGESSLPLLGLTALDADLDAAFRSLTAGQAPAAAAAPTRLEFA